MSRRYKFTYELADSLGTYYICSNIPMNIVKEISNDLYKEIKLNLKVLKKVDKPGDKANTCNITILMSHVFNHSTVRNICYKHEIVFEEVKNLAKEKIYKNNSINFDVTWEEFKNGCIIQDIIE